MYDTLIMKLTFLRKNKNDTIKNLKGYVELDLVCIYNRNIIVALSMCNF